MRPRSCLLAILLLAAARTARAEDTSTRYSRVTPALAGGVWAFTQLIPSPLLVTGSHHVGGGVRWQVTPFVYSFGVASHPFRTFIVEPVARHAGALELYGSPEWACCSPTGGTAWLGRAGFRIYMPIVARGESLSWSAGASYYRATDGDGASIEVGAYVLYGVFGLTVTVSPNLSGREVISALNIRYF